MAHADYDCCALCDSKLNYNSDAETKKTICGSCVANLARKGVIAGTVDELLAWMRATPPATVIATLSDLIRVCYYTNDVDAAWKEVQAKTKVIPMNDKPLVIYHGPCLDGLTAAWVVSKHIPDAEFQMLNYGDPFDFERARDREVVLTDFCFKLPEMEKLLGLAQKVIVFDHHLTAKETLEKLAGTPNLFVHFDVMKSGAGVAWDIMNPIGERPLLISQVEFNDTHAPQDVPLETRKTIEFFRALKPEFASVERMFRFMEDPFTQPVVEQAGAILVERKALHVADLVKNAEAIQLQLPLGDDLGTPAFRVWATEAPYFLNSETGGALARHPLPDGSTPDFAVTYTREPGKWRVSLRSTDQQQDVRVVAQAFGGGGHRNAAGFECQKLPWEA